MNAQIVTVTLNPAVDKTLSVERVIPDRKLSGQDVHRYPAGGGINVARAVRQLGGAAVAMWSRGGATGEILASLLEDEKVPQVPIPVEDVTRENIIVGDQSSGEQYRFGMPGAELNERERDAWVKRISGLTPPPKFLVLSGSLPPGASPGWYAELVRSVPKETRVVVDTKKDALSQALEAGVFLIKPNLHELEEIVGMELKDDDDVERAARDVIGHKGAKAVLVSLGRGGALLVTDAQTERISAPVVRLRSKVGAGDSMVAGLVLALQKNRSLSDAAKFAVAAGAAAVMTGGTQLCRREDAEKLFERILNDNGL